MKKRKRITTLSHYQHLSVNVKTNLDLIICAFHCVDDGTLEPPCLDEIEPLDWRRLIFHSAFIDVWTSKHKHKSVERTSHLFRFWPDLAPELHSFIANSRRSGPDRTNKTCWKRTGRSLKRRFTFKQANFQTVELNKLEDQRRSEGAPLHTYRPPDLSSGHSLASRSSILIDSTSLELDRLAARVILVSVSSYGGGR